MMIVVKKKKKKNQLTLYHKQYEYYIIGIQNTQFIFVDRTQIEQRAFYVQPAFSFQI